MSDNEQAINCFKPPQQGINEVNPSLSAFARRSFSEGGLFVLNIFLSLISGAGFGGRSPLSFRKFFNFVECGITFISWN